MRKYGDSRKGVELFKIEEKKAEESKKRPPLIKAKGTSSKDDSSKRKRSDKRVNIGEKAPNAVNNVEYRQKLEAYEPLKVDYKSMEALNFVQAHGSAGDLSASSDMASSSMRSLTSSRRSPSRRTPVPGK